MDTTGVDIFQKKQKRKAGEMVDENFHVRTVQGDWNDKLGKNNLNVQKISLGYFP
jgi:hypothetical protein